MRIENRLLKSKDDAKSKKILKEKGLSSFSDIISSIEGEYLINVDVDNPTEKDIKKLSELITELGENLSKEPAVETFLMYKKHLKLFLDLTLKNFEKYEFSIKKRARDRITVLQVVDTVDKLIAEIADLLLKQEKDRLIYLKLTNQIKGLIIDLVL